jgi:stearoyl-CoA desaturase (Delta-9 desaturase)
MRASDEKINVLRSTGFILMHLSPLLAIWAGVSWTAIGVCILAYYIRMFGITAGYHRYFSHRTFKTSRAFQFVLAFLGATAAQKGPLWWAAHHRTHHRHSDTEEDIHSPGLKGFWWSHVGWILCDRYHPTDSKLVRDFDTYPELRFINNHHSLPPFLFAVMMFGFGWLLNRYLPGLGTSGLEMLVWGFFVSTVLLYHGTFAINSLTHVIGRRRFATNDDSRNNWFLALLTMGEGWHNNHHYYPSSERQGFFWWEIDLSHYLLKTLSWVGVVWDLRKPPRVVATVSSRDD